MYIIYYKVYTCTVYLPEYNMYLYTYYKCIALHYVSS